MKAGGKTFRSGFVAIIGRSNVGKSTLLNRILGEKVAIISDKPQTTRNRIRGILTSDEFQIIFLDTPGIHKARDAINRYMVKTALSTFDEADIVLFLVEPSPGIGKGDRFIAMKLQELHTPVFLLVNKIDTVLEKEIPTIVSTYQNLTAWERVFPVSAKTGEGVEAVVQEIVARLPEGPLYFPPDQCTDRPLRFMAAEIVREKVFNLTSQEVPYSVAVVIESFKGVVKGKEALTSIEAIIHVERDSQKGIIIGKGGEMLKKIGTLARHELEALLGQNVYLRLWVKVSRGWTNDDGRMRRLGYGQ
jgi:GTP-binding protein Era